jgi:hypothetical protein
MFVGSYEHGDGAGFGGWVPDIRQAPVTEGTKSREGCTFAGTHSAVERMLGKMARCLSAILLIGMWAAAQTAITPRPLPPPGRLVDVGGWKLHLNCTGEVHSAQPAVILESGAGDFSVEWSLVQPKVAALARISPTTGRVMAGANSAHTRAPFTKSPMSFTFCSPTLASSRLLF